MVSYRDFETLIIPIVTAIIGIIFAMILYTLYDEGIIVDEMITGTITINDLMAIVVVLWFIFGIILAAVKK